MNVNVLPEQSSRMCMPSRLARRPLLRTVLLTSGDVEFRSRLREQLIALRWMVREASGGAEAIAELEHQACEAMLLDGVLSDLEVCEFASDVRQRHPAMDLIWLDGQLDESGPRSPRRNELIYALRRVQEETARTMRPATSGWTDDALRDTLREAGADEEENAQPSGAQEGERPCSAERARPAQVAPLPEMVGESPEMVELARMVRLVAPRSTAVLIHGETGTGKELVANAVHALSKRANKPFVVLNCAAIPESLLEAELFGHTRGAFTGAVQSRQGRIEAADGGTLFLDEIGEMPLALQAKMLRFLESGELQRVGDNQTLRVKVRVIAASHQPLKQRAAEGVFRLDLYHRLAVFPVSVPPLRERMNDMRALAAYLLNRLGQETPLKRLSPAAAAKLVTYDWPGNVRELAHVLERAAILAEDRREIAAEEIRF